ncbi:MAG TPA: methionyl-tRNA formyltransferase [Solirubrobacteraceae bacterium]|nr:methionyl-tRNA formyltransferase [Solirubrobacteraceae bacterium]
MRTVYLGTSAFAAAILRRLHASPHRPALVVSRPDRPQGRGRRLAPPPTVVVARELGLDVYQPESVNDPASLDRIDASEPEALIVCAFGALIREPLLSRHPILNVHPSLLPRWRGAAPIERAILAGDAETGVSIMRLTAGLDSGPICLQERIPIAPQDDYGAVAARLQRLGSDLLVRALDERPPCVDQDERRATYAEKLTTEDRRIDPDQPAEWQARRVRALSPHIGAYLEQPDGTRLGVWEARVAGDRLELLTVQPPGKRPMAWADYQRGRRL